MKKGKKRIGDRWKCNKDRRQNKSRRWRGKWMDKEGEDEGRR